MEPASLSVLIATRNRPAMVARCVASLLQQRTEVTYEVIILDQSDAGQRYESENGSRAVRVVACSFGNKSRALNEGIRLATGTAIAVIDDDCIADVGWIIALHAALERYPGAIITGRVIAGELENGALPSRLHDAATETKVYRRRIITPIFKLSGCNFAFSRQTYSRVGPFNERLSPGSPFKASEDNEWSYRALRMRLPLVYYPAALITHRSWRSEEGDREQMTDYGYAAGAFFKVLFLSSALDFAYHFSILAWWLVSRALFSRSKIERRLHRRYAANFTRGFHDYLPAG
jgi:GT2 family glycosyltransferase